MTKRMLPASTVLTGDEIKEVLERTVGLARACDVMVILTLGGTIEEAAEYAWDHLLGEPDSPSETRVRRVMREIAAEVRGVAV